jgi:hypothetical protein
LVLPGFGAERSAQTQDQNAPGSVIFLFGFAGFRRRAIRADPGSKCAGLAGSFVGLGLLEAC